MNKETAKQTPVATQQKDAEQPTVVQEKPIMPEKPTPELSPIEREYVRPTQRVPAIQRDRTVFPEHVEQLPDKRYCWALEEDIQDRINAWYDFVKDIHGNRVQMVANKSLPLGAIKRNQYLMMVDEKYWQEDFQKEQSRVVQLDRKKMSLQPGQYRPKTA